MTRLGTVKQMWLTAFYLFASRGNTRVASWLILVILGLMVGYVFSLPLDAALTR
jgi:hypothetical protein